MPELEAGARRSEPLLIILLYRFNPIISCIRNLLFGFPIYTLNYASLYVHTLGTCTCILEELIIILGKFIIILYMIMFSELVFPSVY